MSDPSLPHGAPVPPVPKQPVLAYVICLVMMSLLGVCAILGLELFRPEKDNTQIIATILGMIAPTTGVIILLIHNGAAIKEVHYSLNSRLTEFMGVVRSEALEKGRQQGLAQGGGGAAPLAPPAPPASDEEGRLVVPLPIPVPPILLIPTEEERP